MKKTREQELEAELLKMKIDSMENQARWESFWVGVLSTLIVLGMITVFVSLFLSI